MLQDAPVEVGRGVLVAHQAETHLDGGDLVGPGHQLNLDVGVRAAPPPRWSIPWGCTAGSVIFSCMSLAGRQGGVPGILHGPGIVLLHGAFHPFITADGRSTPRLMSIMGTQPAASSRATSNIPSLVRQIFCLIPDLLFVAVFTLPYAIVPRACQFILEREALRGFSH